MPSARPSAIVGSLALATAVIIAVALPLGFGWLSYHHTADLLMSRAAVAADHLALHAGHNPDWRQRPAAVAAVVAPRGTGPGVFIRVHDGRGGFIAEVGSAGDSLTVVREAPVVAAGETVAALQAGTSLAPLLWQMLWVALCGAVLGLMVHGAVRRFPRRMLDRAVAGLERANADIRAKNAALEETNDQLRRKHEALQQVEVELRTQNYRFDLALSNMSQGLCMFDDELRLIVCNRAYQAMYRLPDALAKPGTPLRTILEYRAANGMAGLGDPQKDLVEWFGVARSLAAGDYVRELADGRVIAVAHRPMAGGGFVATHEDVTARRHADARITHLARHDVLTDLPNRVLLREELEAALTRPCGEDGDSVALLMLDLDRFKAVNEALGHPAGDLLLREVARRLRGCLGERHLIARFGSDEFAVLMLGGDQPADAVAVAERILADVAEPVGVNGQQVVPSASIGIAVASSGAIDPDRLLKNADLALFRARRDGGGRLRLFEPAMDAQAQVRRALELDLRSAFRKGEFELFYQPLVYLADGALSGFEALIRWRHPERGLVPPGQFIAIAEEIGLIVPLGEWVLREACREAASWPDDLKVAVNLSSEQFKPGANLAGVVVSALSAAGLAARRLELEITESVLLAESAETLATLHQLRRLGISVSLDDFGTGYSSLSYLRRFAFDKIKIDQSFVRELSTRSDCSAIVRAVAGLAKTLGMATVAEGVETLEQLIELKAQGCTEGQGYLFSPPVPAAQARALIRTGKRREAADTPHELPIAVTCRKA